MKNLQLLIDVAEKLQVPSACDRVFSEECIYSFDSPYTDTGLYISLHTYEGVGAAYLGHHSRKTGSILYLHSKRLQVRREEEQGDDTSAEKELFQKMGKSSEGGFSICESKFEVIKEFFLVLIEEGELRDTAPLSDESIPTSIMDVCQGIINHHGISSHYHENSRWDGDSGKIISKYTDNLIQLQNGTRISNDPASWKCEKSGDTKNLWLNLSTGYIGGGRKNWDGSGGSGAALEHYKDTGYKYPLSVKLGTITPHGADVYSYDPDEDDLILDPKLAEHLSHWGIDIMKLTKTDKSMSELDVELNMQYDWNKVMEDGCEQVLMSGAGLVGLKNIGSSCYLNSVMQVICSLPEIIERYVELAPRIIASDSTNDVAGDFIVQMSKLTFGIATDTYAIPPMTLGDPFESLLEKFSVAPRMFKSVVSKGNQEFSSGRQQDASEYFQHLLNTIKRAERNSMDRITDKDGNKQSTASFFEFFTEKRILDDDNGEIKYIGSRNVNSVQNVLELRIPVDKAINKPEVEMSQVSKKVKTEDDVPKSENQDMKLIIPFEDCLGTFFGEEKTSMVVNGITRSVSITTKLIGFPRYLMIKLGRYMIDSNWKQIKIDANICMPLSLDLSHLKATGPRAGENLMSESNTPTDESMSLADETIVQQLIQMGLEQNGCIRATVAVQNESAEQAMEWYFNHADDPGFHEPLANERTSESENHSLNFESISLLSSMGFSEKHVLEALKSTDNDVERAADWLFSHPENITDADSYALSEDEMNPSQEGIDGSYKLHAIISHIGKNTDTGHYVCHIKKEDCWVLYNDEKVSLSKNPPLDCGFMYLYRRCNP